VISLECDATAVCHSSGLCPSLHHKRDWCQLLSSAGCDGGPSRSVPSKGDAPVCRCTCACGMSSARG
jgi:hypothetical protein